MVESEMRHLVKCHVYGLLSLRIPTFDKNHLMSIFVESIELQMAGYHFSRFQMPNLNDPS